MDIPNDLLQKLKCTKCSVYLSRGPVYLQHDGAGLCGRCFTPERAATRNTQYETTAQLLRFPCKYSDLGCGDTVPFVQEGEVIAHEEVCEHRQWVCPVLGSARCDWLGSRVNILQHCQDRHPDRILGNPCSIEHDITRSNERTFLLQAFQVLFLLHAKVCVTSAKIYHSVRHLGRTDESMTFNYNLDVKRNDELLSKKGQVAPQGCLVIQEDTSLVLGINSLLSVLGGFDGVLFTIELKRRVCKAEKVCTGCEMQEAVVVYPGKDDRWCERCAPARRTCKNRNCTYEDINSKCWKHEMYFCQQRTDCRVCGEAIARGSLSAHFDAACVDVYRAGSTWRPKRTAPGSLWCLVSSDAGTAVCWCWLTDSYFLIHVFIPMPSEQLREFRCAVRVTQPATGFERTYTPDIQYNEYYDWCINIDGKEFSSWKTEFNICVDIISV